MMRSTLLSLALALVVAIPTAAWAQKKGKGKTKDEAAAEKAAAEKKAAPEPDPMAEEVSDESSDPDAPAGSEENPNAPPAGFGDESEVNVAAQTEASERPAGYPIEEVLRPITLPRYMTEVALDYPIAVDPFQAGGVLRGFFGITAEAQLGLSYGFGTATEDGYEVGKTVAVDFSYLIQNWVAAQVTIPILFDPFALGATIAAPMKFTFIDKLSLVLAEELVSFKIAKFFPVVENAAITEELIAADAVDTELPDAILRVGLRVIYQAKPNIAVDVRARQIFLLPDDDTTQRNAFNFDGGLMYSISEKIDLGLRLGWSDLAEVDTFGGALVGAIRI